MSVSMRHPEPSCLDCDDTGILTWETDGKRYWSPCGCDAGEQLQADLRAGEADIRAGRLHKWSDVRKEIA